MLGIFVAQLFRLTHTLTPDPVFGFYVIGIPLASISQAMAIIVLMVGCHRFFKLQKNISLGYAITGGWEVNTIAFLGIAVSFIDQYGRFPVLTPQDYHYSICYCARYHDRAKLKMDVQGVILVINGGSSIELLKSPSLSTCGRCSCRSSFDLYHQYMMSQLCVPQNLGSRHG